MEGYWANWTLTGRGASERKHVTSQVHQYHTPSKAYVRWIKGTTLILVIHIIRRCSILHCKLDLPIPEWGSFITEFNLTRQYSVLSCCASKGLGRDQVQRREPAINTLQSLVFLEVFARWCCFMNISFPLEQSMHRGKGERVKEPINSVSLTHTCITCNLTIFIELKLYSQQLPTGNGLCNFLPWNHDISVTAPCLVMNL